MNCGKLKLGGFFAKVAYKIKNRTGSCLSAQVTVLFLILDDEIREKDPSD